MAILNSTYRQDPGIGGYANQPRQSIPPSGGVTGSYGLYNTAVGQQANDYSNIMKGYGDLSSSPAYANTANLATTGGYSDQNIADIRERSISPIRSMYASAKENVGRNTALSGGYSPNANAVQAKLARDESTQVGDATTNVNAQLAQNIAGNKMQMAPQFSANAAAPLQNQQSLYGTTPALSKTFGDQALGAADLQNRINQAPRVGSSYGNTSVYGNNGSLFAGMG